MSENQLNITMLFDKSYPLPSSCLGQVRVINTRLNVIDASAISEAARKGNRLSQKTLDDILARTDIFFGMFDPKVLVAKAPNLKWVQHPMSGVDIFGFPEFVKSDILLTNASGIHGVQVGEMAIWHMISLAKNTRRICEDMRKRRTQLFKPVVLFGKTACILALGPIGKYIAKLCHGFGMKVIAVEADSKVKCRYCHTIYSVKQLHLALVQADVVIDCLPLLDSTNEIMGEKEFMKMKKTAFFINVGRGGTVDQDALIRALKEGTIAGAGLDVKTPEELPPDHPLWKLLNVTLTPHMGGQHPDYTQLATNLFCRNLKRYLAGRKMLTQIDKKTLKPIP